MSYEGYVRFLCANGHFAIEDCYTFDEDTPCRVCGAAIAWQNHVDQTNGSGEEYVVALEIAEPAPTCPACGHETAPPRYKVPSGAENARRRKAEARHE